MSEKPKGFEFWRKVLKGARFVVAPMVDQSELAWRMLSRKLGAELCYTPMLHSATFVRDAGYRKDGLMSCEGDRPLIVQFCANDPNVFLKAAKLAEPHCDAVDLNLGCPQTIARKGHYGAFLQDDWDLVASMVSLVSKNLSIPLTCKIRVFENIDKTVQYAKLLEKSGCQLLTVHGRTIDQKGLNTGLASWDHIKAVCENLSIPVVANGNIQYLKDVHRCMEYTGVVGVMSAEGNLSNPALFLGEQPPMWEMAEEYLRMVDRYPCPLSFVRGHLFRIWHHVLCRHTDMREVLGKAQSLNEMKKLCQDLKQRLLPEYTSAVETEELPYWRCQPYVRKPKSKEKRPLEQNLNTAPTPDKIQANNTDESCKTMSKRQLKRAKKMKKSNMVKIPGEERWVKCSQCKGNPKGQKCLFNLCRACCKVKNSVDVADCPAEAKVDVDEQARSYRKQGHHIWFKTKWKNKKRNGPPDVQPSSDPPDVQPSGDPPDVQPSGDPADVQPRSDPPDVQLSGDFPDVQPSGDPHDVQPSGDPADVQPRSDSPDVQLSGDYHDVQPSSDPPDMQPSGDPPDVQPSGDPPDVQPRGDRP